MQFKVTLKPENVKEHGIKLDDHHFISFCNIFYRDAVVYGEDDDYELFELTNLSKSFADVLMSDIAQSIESCCGVKLITLPDFDALDKLNDVEKAIIHNALFHELDRNDAGIKYAFISREQLKDKRVKKFLKTYGLKKNRTMKGGTIEYRYQENSST